MAQPPVSVLTDPVTCMPAWLVKYSKLSTKLVASGCPINALGNAPCDPVSMAVAAGKSLGQPVSHEVYTLARYMQSEVGTFSVAERVAVAQDALNRVRYTTPSVANVNNLLLYRQSVGHPNRGFYGPIHGANLSAPYGRWAATTSDPSIANLQLAIAIMSGEVPADFNKGADDQYGPATLIAKNGMAAMINDLKAKGNNRVYWVGPLPGVDHFRTMQFRTIKELDPKSALGQQLINRAIAAVQAPKPNWSTLPPCGGGGSVGPGTDSTLTTVIADHSAIAIAGGSLLAVGGLLAGAFAWRRRAHAMV